ncbi:endocuticle structural glycoprotein ABD-4-like [Galleria mellonella]|uniref:Endocuticle structural glycoprotein ABD-4-like n=1 Tax=Galleria mellonella TaxID=7137 RepID=A0ABM3MUH4_GALME|nr:endocuticle structural glycoprotein ABD-4-like [Galleria mellonella]
MKITTGLFAVLMIVTTVCCQQQEAIIRNDFEGPNPDGTYKWALQTEGGIYHEQRGSVQSSGSEPSLLVEGQYQYTAPDGQIINVLYRADENGFQAQGDHLPTPPPIPAAIQRALDYIASLTPSIDNQYK